MNRIATVVILVAVGCSVAEPTGPAPDRDAWHPADVPPDPAVAAEDVAGGPEDAAAEAGGGEDVSGPDAEGPAPDVDAVTYPDPAFVHVRTGEAVVRAGDPYLMEEPVQYRTTDLLPDLDVRCMSTAGEAVWAGTASGLVRYDAEADRFVAVPLGEGADGNPVTDLSRGLTGDGRLVTVQAGFLHLMDPDTATVESFSTAPLAFAVIEAGDDEVWASPSAGGLWRVTFPADRGDPVIEPVLDAGTGAVRDLSVDATGVVWMATDSGLKTWDGQAMGSRTAADGTLLDDDVRVVMAIGDLVVAGTAEGLAFLHETGHQTIPAGVGLLPEGDITAMDSEGFVVVLGHDIGTTAVVSSGEDNPIAGEVHHCVGRRWLPSDEVRAVAAFDGDLFVGTAAGVSRITWKTHTFAGKAEAMEALQEAHFWRLGFVPSDIGTDDPWNPTQWRTWDHDNDGLWTQMQIGAWCYAYAATRDERFYQKARRAMDMMFLQIDIPAVDFEAAGLGRGFITRSLVRDDEGAVFNDKKTKGNWHLVHYKDGHDYYWKDDTSSDETTGHFFGFPLFYDLCAKDEAEREAVAEHAAALAGFIVDHGFRLVDLDGQPTTFGHWEPERLAAAVDGLDPCLAAALEAEDPSAAIQACFGSWYGEGWLNSVEILGHLLATWHMTGEPRFYDAYDMLITKYRYDNVAMPHSETVTITDPAFMNHSDHELAMLAYHTLIRYEPDDTRRQKWIEGLLFLYEHEVGERNPLWAAFVALAAGPEAADIEPALQSLREIPFDRRDWRVDNTHRADALDWPNDRHGHPQFDRVFPYDEIPTVWWNSNFHAKADGGDGRSVSGPMAWLLPYWAFRYGGVIGE